MAYEMSKSEIIEHLREDAVYFPFEQLHHYNHMKKKENIFSFSEEEESAYMEFFRDVKIECEKLIVAEPNHEDLDLWQEAIDEINKIL